MVLLVLGLLAPTTVLSFMAPQPSLAGVVTPTRTANCVAPYRHATTTTTRQCRSLHVLSQQRQQLVLTPELTDKRVTELFAWVSRAFAGEDAYNDLSLALVATFGNLPEDSQPREMVRKALEQVPDEEAKVGQPILTRDRERASLGAMGAAQWTGQWMTRPHALLVTKNLSSVDQWVSGLSRGARRTLKKAEEAEHSGVFSVQEQDIRGGFPAPHSSLAHFRCVVAHEVRLLAGTPDMFFDALAQAVSRYMGTTRMTGQVREYRNAEGKVIAFAHEVRKGRTIRGQWFYADDDAAKNYVWFHSVLDLVRRAVADPDVDTVDLGPSGSDAFSELKQRYGFVSVDDWPALADYTSRPFWHPTRADSGPATELKGLIESLMKGG